MRPIRRHFRALSAVAGALLLALAVAACGTSDDPLADLPGPPEARTTSTGPAGAQGAAGAGEAKGGKGDAGDDDDDDSPKGGDGGDDDDDDGGGGSGGGGGSDGGDDSDGGDRPAGPRPSGVVSTRTISSSPGDQLTFDVSGLVAPPSKLTLIMRNRSSTEHGIAIAGDNIKTESEAVDPGETARVTIELPAGEYEFYCPVDEHQAEGMSGTLSIGVLPPGAR